ncbi:PREDICTED: cationic amino acid transporter 2, vacuolar-like isoform X3 [Nicotiana attenuata]|uniref:cationic amino acid transporter 2, vacuolar-like isoform X3 n=1 Tax=Nicotiana attenuata TaxID=49451 RepID=UPI000905D5A1|nr:PREDICTED: cationic amino acid transporter 2, vacuolar-like isoform X3 [Nicotiana attenuata]
MTSNLSRDLQFNAFNSISCQLGFSKLNKILKVHVINPKLLLIKTRSGQRAGRSDMVRVENRCWFHNWCWGLYSGWNGCKRALWSCPHLFLFDSWNSSCSFGLLLRRACKSLSICWECLSLLLHMCRRRCCVADRLGADIGIHDWRFCSCSWHISKSGLAMLFGGSDSLPAFLARHTIPGLDVVVDPCAAILVFVVTGLLCVGIKESTVVQGFVTTANVCAMIFITVAGGYLGFKTGWPGYELPVGYFPYGVDGMLAGASTVFFAFIGFDSVASTAEEVKNPQRDLPMGIGFALSICCSLYMLVSAVIVGLVPYYAMDPDTPISSAFASHGIKWAAYIVTVGACTALCSTLMGSLLPQPRILMAMARDGLLPSFFSDVNKHTQVPVKGTVITGLLAGTLAFFMDVEQLSGMVSVGTLLAFTMVAISVLILRYVPPDEVPLPSSFQVAIDSVSQRLSESSSSTDINVENAKVPVVSFDDATPLLDGVPVTHPRVEKAAVRFCFFIDQRRKVAGWTIMFTCIGVFMLTSAASILSLPE